MASLKFLVVDDATFIRDLLKKNLRDNFPGCEVLDASSAKKAQMLLQSNRVDLILCDWEMPEMTGEEFLRWIRGNEKYAQIPFIMVSSRGERDFIVKAVQAGVNDYLGKPFKPESLVTKISNALFKVDKSAKTSNVGADNIVQASGSVDILVSKTEQSRTSVTPNANTGSVEILSGASMQPIVNQAEASSKLSKPKTNARGQAQLKFADFSALGVISDISLQKMRAAIKRENNVPALFEGVVISIVQNDGNDVARLNGYVHSIEAGENRIDAGVIKLTIRFVDDDKEKLEHLSRYIATL